MWTPTSRGLFSVLLVAVLAACFACSKKTSELEKNKQFEPTPSAHASATPPPVRDAAPDPNALTRAEQRGLRTRIDNTQCEAAAKRANVLKGLNETDPKGIELLSGCLKWGNVAWYACVAAATDVDTLKRCNQRLLLPPDDP